MSDTLFPEIPEDLKALDDEALQKLLDDHVSAAALIDADDEEFLAGLAGEEVIAQYEVGVEQIKTLRAEQKERADAHEAYQAKKAELKAQMDEPEDEPEVAEEPEAEVVAEAETPEPEAEATEPVAEEEVAVVAAAETPAPRFSRTPPTPATNRVVVNEDTGPKGTALVASSQYRAENPEPLNPSSLASLIASVSNDLGALPHDGKAVVRQKVKPWQIDHYADGRRVEHGGGEIVWAGPKTKVASAEFEFPGDRTLTGGDDDLEKIRAIMPPDVSVFGQRGTMPQEALTASGGLCAPLTPIYTMPNFATEEEPVWDSLPVFRAARGGVNVPAATYIGDITTAISSISEEEDAQGGTFATKSCQDLTCPDYTETAVNIFAHCREYGNLNARAWPEKIAHENALTMAALVRTQEGFLLDRIKALSVNVTNGAETLGALIYLVDAIVKARFGIIGRLRMPRTTRFRALIPYWVPDMLALDTVQTQFDRFRSPGSLTEYLRSVGIEPTYYLDSPSSGTTQLPDSAQTAAALDGLPDNVQWAIFPEGAFLGIDSGSLELGIVRDSTLNETNDFQVFGERFRNVALLGPAQSAYWVTSDLCASGQFPPAGTARTCD